jgi:hypothetical protein
MADQSALIATGAKQINPATECYTLLVSKEIAQDFSENWTEPVRLKFNLDSKYQIDLLARTPVMTCSLCGAETHWDHCKIICPNHGILATCADPPI